MTEPAEREGNSFVNCIAVIKSIPIAPIAAIAMRLRLLKGRNHDATIKKENTTRVIHSAFLIVKLVPDLMCTSWRLHGTFY